MEEKIVHLENEIILLKKRIEVLEKRERNRKIKKIIDIIVIALIIIFSGIYIYKFYGMLSNLMDQI